MVELHSKQELFKMKYPFKQALQVALSQFRHFGQFLVQAVQVWLLLTYHPILQLLQLIFEAQTAQFAI